MNYITSLNEMTMNIKKIQFDEYRKEFSLLCSIPFFKYNQDSMKMITVYDIRLSSNNTPEIFFRELNYLISTYSIKKIILNMSDIHNINEINYIYQYLDFNAVINHGFRDGKYFSKLRLLNIHKKSRNTDFEICYYDLFFVTDKIKSNSKFEITEKIITIEADTLEELQLKLDEKRKYLDEISPFFKLIILTSYFMEDSVDFDIIDIENMKELKGYVINYKYDDFSRYQYINCNSKNELDDFVENDLGLSYGYRISTPVKTLFDNLKIYSNDIDIIFEDFLFERYISDLNLSYFIYEIFFKESH